MNNREKREYVESVHMFLGLQRRSKGKKKNCIRHVIRGDEEESLAVFEAKLNVIGGEWRIHKTVNARNIEMARKWLLKHLIDTPENASFVDTAWRTALLQKNCRVTDYFMLDIDIEDIEGMNYVEDILEGATPDIRRDVMEDYKGLIVERIKSPSGWHYITKPFDTREICKLEYVTLLRDGYKYIKTVGAI